MAGCVFKPTVDGRVSDLYTQLYKATGNDRKLSNFLYAYSTLNDCRKNFTKEQFNIQKEIKFSEFKKFIKLDEILDKKHKVQEVARSIGALDANNKPIVYQSIEEVIAKLGDFNTAQHDYMATIKKTTKGFEINLDVVNAENYLDQFKLQQKIDKYNIIKTFLERAGFKVQFSAPEDTAVINLDNTRLYGLLKWLDASVNNKFKINKSDALILVKLNQNSIWYSRLREGATPIFDSDESLAAAIADFTGGDTTIGYNWKAESHKRLVESFLYAPANSIQAKLKEISISELDIALQPATAQQYQGVQVFATDGQTMQETLKGLYSKFGLNHDTLQGKLESVTKISELIYRITDIAKKRTGKIDTQKTDYDFTQQMNLDEEEARMNAGDYISAITEVITSLYQQIATSQAQIDALQKADEDLIAESHAVYSEQDKILKVIRNKASVINNNLQLLNALKSVLGDVLNIETLEQDVELKNADTEQINALKQLINAIQTGDARLDVIEKNLKEQEFEIINAFLKISWGESETKTIAGSEVTLEQVIKNQILSPTWADSLINSIADCNDPMIAMMGEMVTIRHRVRDAKLRDLDFQIRVATEELTKSNSTSNFMYARENGKLTGKLVMPYDRTAYEAALKEYALNHSKFEVEKWIEENTELITYTHTQTIGQQTIPYSYTCRQPKANLFPNAAYNSLTEAQKKYHTKMMNIKAAMQSIAPVENFELDTAIQISADMLNAINEAKGDSAKIRAIVKNKFVEAAGVVHVDDEYHYAGGNVAYGTIDLFGNESKKIPVLFTTTLEDLDALSTDFSRALTNYAISALEFEQMNLIEDAVLMCQDYAMSTRDYQSEKDGKPVGKIVKVAGEERLVTAYDQKQQAKVASILNEWIDKTLYKRYYDNDLTRQIDDTTKISANKLASSFIGLGSVLGLGLNVLGAETNFLIGKIQMLIDAGCSEFFNMKDLAWADVEYNKKVLQCVSELNSENTKSLLTLMMNYFNVTDDLKNKIASKHYSKQLLNRMFNNSSVLFMYEAGEHALHAQTMLAVLHRNKVYKTDSNGNKVGKPVSLYEVFDVETVGNNGRLVIKPGYVTEQGEAITEDGKFLNTIEKQIKYCNNTMHGNLGDDDKGLIHRKIWGRFLMNFRQWMVGHYTRRFGKNKHNFELGEDREGYYITSLKFLYNVGRDIYLNKGQILAAFKEEHNNLSEMEKANVKRALMETAVLVLLFAIKSLLGAPDKDDRGNWIKRHMQYICARLGMEVEASTPVAGQKFIGSILTQLNSPFAAMSTASKILNLLDLSLLNKEVQTGIYMGENMYIHKNKKAIPFYQQLHTVYNLADDEYAFTLFGKSDYR